MKKRKHFNNLSPQPSKCYKSNQQAKRTYWGVDVANGFIILNNGNPCVFYLFVDAPTKKPALPSNKLRACKKKTKVVQIKDLSEIIKPNDVVILEQTGNYGIRYAQIFSQLGATVMLADSKMFAFFRRGRNIHKNDKVDAYLLRQMFFDVEFRDYIYKFIPQKHYLRQLIKSTQKLEKERTRLINRTKNFLAVTLPYENYHHLAPQQFIKKIPEIRQKVSQIPHPYTETILISLDILENYERLLKIQEKEIESIVKNHPDYEILSTIKGFGTKTIATLIAYYWDIKRFKSVTQFKGYLLKGTIREQSGTTIDKRKNIKSRPEVKKMLYILWKNTARRKDNPLKHIVRLSYDINKKKAWLKFADKLLEIIFYMLKYRLTFEEAIKYTLNNKAKELQNLLNQLTKPINLGDKEEIQNFLKKLAKLNHLIKNWVAYQNTASEGGATELCHPPQDYLLYLLSLKPLEVLKALQVTLSTIESSLTEVLMPSLKTLLKEG
ncbi:MAG: hypothetical protein DSZ31_00840 [Gammaproteobacteria bacterium]|nr:MAG: hypothetical protein DSZ31_00840 [Gammaproteobacteria bacterium]